MKTLSSVKILGRLGGFIGRGLGAGLGAGTGFFIGGSVGAGIGLMVEQYSVVNLVEQLVNLQFQIQKELPIFQKHSIELVI